MSQPYYPDQPYTPPPQSAPRSKYVVPAWLAFSFGIAGAVFIPVPIINNATALLALAGVICAIVALFGSRKLIAAIGLVLCLGGLVGTYMMQQQWLNELDRIEREIQTP